MLFDGLSEDRTLDIVKTFSERLNLRILRNPKIKHVYALNQGIKEAKGDYFILISGHSFVKHDFLEKSVKTFRKVKNKEPLSVGVGGRIRKVYENELARLVGLIYSSPFSGASSFWYSENSHFTDTIPFGLYDKKIVQRLGCFDEDMITGNDFELNMRLVKNGYKLYYDPQIMFSYYTRSSLSKFLKQSFNYGAVKGMCVRKGYFKSFWVVPALFVLYQLVVLLVAASDFWLLLFALLFPLGLYGAVTLVFSAKLSKRRRFDLFLPCVYWLFHNLIGLGFVTALILGRRTFR